MVDWRIAEQVATLVAGQPEPGVPPKDLEEVTAESERLVTAYTRLRPARELPAPEPVDRRDWIRTNLRNARTMLAPLFDGFGEGLGPLRGPLRSGAGVLVGAEMGALVGYLGQRVLGQYDLVLLDATAPPRLLFVAPNLAQAARQFDADPDELWRWVALHEVTHAVQFTGVPWLREHLAGEIRGLLDDLEVSVDLGRLSRMPGSDNLRALVDAVREKGLMAVVASDRQRERIDRMQAAMAVLEGHAEHVMDAVGTDVLPGLPRLRAALERRRRTQSTMQRLLNRLLGLDLKLRQYEVGKRFCDAVVERGGITGLNQVWSGPAALPSLAELEDPGAWLVRVGRDGAQAA